jgi:ADP-ribose pyrophosphatase
MPSPSYLAKLPESTRYVGDAGAGEIEIVSRSDARKVEGRTGILFEDSLHFFVRDVVKFPSGDTRAQWRIIGCTMADGPSGVVALAWRDGRIFLREMFRHATRRWELEAPRGQRETGCTAEDAARREVDEELGFRVEKIELIGEVSGDSALLASTLPVFWGELAPGEPRDNPESSEAFGEIISLSPAELLEKIRAGHIRDSYTLSAITLAQTSGKLNLPYPSR